MSSSSEQEELDDHSNNDEDGEYDNDSVPGEPENSADESIEELNSQVQKETSDEEEVCAIDASSTESDEDEDVLDDDKDIPKALAPIKNSPKVKQITEKIIEKFEKRLGKQLYIRFPEKLPKDVEEFEKEVKALSELIVTVHKPRQKSARFCLVDFADSTDRDLTMKELIKNSAQTKLIVSLPRTENGEFVKMLVDKKLSSIEKKKAKALVKRERRKTLSQKKFSSTIMVINIPNRATPAQIKELFPDAVDMHIKAVGKKFEGTSVAMITLPSTADATKNVKRNLTLCGNKLIIKFNTATSKKKQNSKKLANGKNGEESIKSPIAPKQHQKNSKNEANGAKPAKEQQVPPKKAKLALSQKRKGDDAKEEKFSPKVPKVAAAAPVELLQKKPKPSLNTKKGKNESKPKDKKPFPLKKDKGPPIDAGKEQQPIKKKQQPIKRKQQPIKEKAKKAAAE